MIEKYIAGLLERMGLDSAHRAQASAHLAWGIVFPWVFGWWGLVLWVVVGVLIQELIVDGHLKRIRTRTETPEELRDLVWDLVTRSAGSVAYILMAIF